MIEFLGLGVLLGVPLVYLLIALSTFHASSLAAVTVADQAARLFADAPDRASAEARITATVPQMAQGHGIDPADVTWVVTCEGGVDVECPRPGAAVRVEVSIAVPLPLMQGSEHPLGVVRSESTVLIPRFG